MSFYKGAQGCQIDPDSKRNALSVAWLVGWSAGCLAGCSVGKGWRLVGGVPGGEEAWRCT